MLIPRAIKVLHCIAHIHRPARGTRPKSPGLRLFSGTGRSGFLKFRISWELAGVPPDRRKSQSDGGHLLQDSGRALQTRLDRYIKEKGYKDIHALVAFSGTVHDPETDIDYTEPGMNLDIVTQRPISESNLPERFRSSATVLPANTDPVVSLVRREFITNWRRLTPAMRVRLLLATSSRGRRWPSG